MYILGVDPSLSSTGLAWLDTDEPEWITSRVRTLPPSAGADRLHEQARRMSRIAGEVREKVNGAHGVWVDLVVIEGLSMGSHGNATRDLAGLWWLIVRELVVRTSAELMVVAPATRAKYATGSGRASKSDVLAAVRETYPRADVPGHDVADAVALAALGARVKGFPVEATPWPWQVDVAATVVARIEKEQD